MKCAVFDIETTSLRSDQGFMLCVGIKPLGEPGRIIGLADMPLPRDPLIIDRNLAVAVAKELHKYDIWITQNGKMFDVPYLNDRLIIGRRPILDKHWHIDIMYYSRAGMSRLSSSKLDWVSRVLNVGARKTPLDLKVWKLAEREAIGKFRDGRRNYDKVVHHCLRDLDVTEAVFERVKPKIRSISR